MSDLKPCPYHGCKLSKGHSGSCRNPSAPCEHCGEFSAESVKHARQRILDIAGDVEYDNDPETLRIAVDTLERAIRAECVRPINPARPNSARLLCHIAQWVESKCTLHNSIEIHYTVDGYEVQEVVGDGARVAKSYKGDTVARALLVAAASNGALDP